MKKIAISLASFVMIAAIFSACTKTDTGKPVITLKGNNPDKVALKSAVSYTDAGATVTDDVDKNITYQVNGTVNMNSAGDYILTYTATDGAGNKAEAVRTVIVDGGLYLEGNYNVHDYSDTPTPSDNGTYGETITASTVTNNKINFVKFAFYQNATVYATISGTTITVPQQMWHCGIAPDDADRTFTGTGTFTTNTTFTINYTELTGGATGTGHGVYTRN